MRQIIFILIIIVITVGSVFVLSDGFIESKSYLSYHFSWLLQNALAMVDSFAGGERSAARGEALIADRDLKEAQELLDSKKPRFFEFAGIEYVKAKIYSTYPFNNRGLLTINAGTDQGIKNASVVTINGLFLLGQVIETQASYSVVRTVFDSGWSLPVKIGSDATDALLVGGRTPQLTLIVNDKKISVGAPVYSSGKEFPYGLKIGEVSAVSNALVNAFQVATLSFSYDASSVREVSVLIQ